MQARTKHTEKLPQYHSVEDSKIVSTRGRIVRRFKLRFNPSLFKHALCASMDTEIFYPPKELFSQEDEATYQRMCVECPAMNACLEWALAHERHGIWAGTTPFNRQAIRKRIGWDVHDPQNPL